MGIETARQLVSSAKRIEAVVAGTEFWVKITKKDALALISYREISNIPQSWDRVYDDNLGGIILYLDFTQA